jgi:hypothetical protein
MGNNSVGEYKKIVKNIITETLTPLYNTKGFLKTGNNFYKPESGFIKYSDLEYFNWNTQVSFSFWFNLHLVYGSFEEEKKINNKILLTKGDSLFFKRTGFLWDEENHMYSMTSAGDAGTLSGRIKKDFETRVFPFFNRFTDIEDVIRFLTDENKRLGRCEYSFRIAIVLAKMGRKEESKQFFSESIGMKEAIINAARHHGIELDE